MEEFEDITDVLNEEETDSVVYCQCNEPAVVRQTKKDGKNKGRRFWACEKGILNGGCRFFKWDDSFGNSTSNRVSPPPKKRPYSHVETEKPTKERKYNEKESDAIEVSLRLLQARISTLEGKFDALEETNKRLAKIEKATALIVSKLN